MFFKKFICNPVLPSVYDDSLSYYEVLCKLGYAVDKLIEEVQKNEVKPETKVYSFDLSAHFTEDDTVEYSGSLSIDDKTKVKCIILSFAEGDSVVRTAILLPGATITIYGNEVNFTARFADGVVNVTGLSGSYNYDCSVDAVVIY